MKYLRKTLIITLVIIGILPVSISLGLNNDIETYDIDIKTNGDSLVVEENILIFSEKNNVTYNKIMFWIQENAEEIKILVFNEPVEYTLNENIYNIDLSESNISTDNNLQVKISYKLGKSIEQFHMKTLYNVTSLSVTFDGNELFSGSQISKDDQYNLLLYRPVETPLSLYIIIVIVLLVILLLVTTFYALRKQKSVKKVSTYAESKELLTNKKTLLMSVLKDIEKQHRNKKISDETYHKLKDEFKQEAVVTMKKLEDLK